MDDGDDESGGVSVGGPERLARGLRPKGARSQDTGVASGAGESPAGKLIEAALIVKLNELYAKLDEVAARKVSVRAGSTPTRQDAGSGQVDTAVTQKAGHVAPSHYRFRMPADLARRGKAPSSLEQAVA